MRATMTTGSMVRHGRHVSARAVHGRGKDRAGRACGAAGAPEARRMADDAREHLTRLLEEIPRRPEAAQELLPLVYDELRALARARMRGERADHTLRATALVHEAYMKLAGDPDRGWQDRAHFFRAAAEAMRRVLIDHARSRGAAKRGSGHRPVRIDASDIGVESDPEQILALDDALEVLRAEDDRAAEVVRLRFYAGLGFTEIAALLDCSERTVMREWAFARARLVELLSDDAEGGGA